MKETIDGMPVSLVIEGEGMSDLSGLEEICRHNHRVIWLTVRDGRRVILKGLAEEVRHHPEEILSLRKEYLLTLRSECEGVVRVYGFEENASLGPLIVMEYVDGIRLDKYIDNIGNGKKSRSLKERKEIARRLAATIQSIHKAGICHRDLKPDNIILRSRDKMPVIIDFGHSDADDFVMYKRSLGTEEYGAPEQRTPSKGSMSSDVYSYGKILEDLLPEERFRYIIEECTKENAEERPDTEWVISQFSKGDRKRYRYFFLSGIVLVIAALCVFFIRYNNQNKIVVPEEMGSDSVSVRESSAVAPDAYQDSILSIPAETMPDPKSTDGKKETTEKESVIKGDIVSQPEVNSPEQILQKYIDEADKINARYGRIGYEIEESEINNRRRMQRADEHYKLADRMDQELERAGADKTARSIMANGLWTHIVMETNRIDGANEIIEKIRKEYK